MESRGTGEAEEAVRRGRGGGEAWRRGGIVAGQGGEGTSRKGDPRAETGPGSRHQEKRQANTPSPDCALDGAVHILGFKTTRSGTLGSRCSRLSSCLLLASMVASRFQPPLRGNAC